LPPGAERTSGILLVEDDELLRDSLRDYLQDLGRVVATADNGRDALDWIGTHGPPRLILLDLRMPVMNGWEFAERKNADPTLAPVPMIVFSADGRLEESAAEMRAAGRLAKPIDLAELERLLALYCGPV
jgi:two-component system, chemotaxis family, chemotaxis protein CheY